MRLEVSRGASGDLFGDNRMLNAERHLLLTTTQRRSHGTWGCIVAQCLTNAERMTHKVEVELLQGDLSFLIRPTSCLPTIQTERCRTVSDNVVSLAATGQNRTVPDASVTRRARKTNVAAALPNRQHTPASLSVQSVGLRLHGLNGRLFIFFCE
jgi:hypothetical protein